MIDTFFFRLILTALALLPPGITKDQLILQPGGESKSIPLGVIRTASQDEHEGVFYSITAKSEEDSGQGFLIHAIDNGLYRIRIPDEKPFDIDMASYFVEIDSEKIHKNGQILSGSDGFPIRIRPENEMLLVSSESPGGTTIFVPIKP